MTFSQHHPVLFALLLALALIVGQLSGSGPEMVENPTCKTECPSTGSDENVDVRVSGSRTLTAGIGLLPRIKHVPMDLILLMLAGIGYGAWRLRSAGGSAKRSGKKTRTAQIVSNPTALFHERSSGTLAAPIASLSNQTDSDGRDNDGF